MTAERPNFGIQVLVDIDDTISEGVFLMYMRAYNAALGLGVSEEDLERHRLDPAIKTTDVPEVKAYRAQGPEAEAEFKRVYATISTSSDIHRNKLTPIEGAQEGVAYWRQTFGDVGYYTVRPPVVKDDTGWWLHRNDYPNVDRLTICKTPQDKLFKILMTHVVECGSSGINMPTSIRAVLIDDGFPKLIEAADELAARYPVARRALGGLAVVAFGAEANRVHSSNNLTIINQPSWKRPDIYSAMAQVLAMKK